MIFPVEIVMDRATLVIVCWAVFGFLLLLFWMPALMARLGATRFTYSGPTNVPEEDPLEKEPDYHFWSSQLHALGYEMVGDLRLQMDFVANQWRANSWVRLLHSPAHQTFAFLQKFPDPFNIWRGIEFVTYMNDEGLTVTKNLPPQLASEDPNILIQGRDAFILSELEAEHLQTLDELKRSGRRPDTEPSPEKLLAVMERLENETGKKESRDLAGRFLSLNLMIHATASVPTAWVFGLAHWSLALTNIILLIVMQLGETVQRRQQAMITRESIKQIISRSHSLQLPDRETSE